ncbi:zonular occludens toxin domain-containing protein [Pseudomonas kuykendallii]|uniref:zonular occludens toxin domain-containing protein n=1 Tax=Pseudomonas kuykendallii TaxID=1007099 RepID=UPI0028D52FA2|nr:zonular occludens toxin domain-containing protein [Pseudomonas kuykendallii]
MAIKIHHGPNGSYKTSGAIQDDAVPALKAGRYIITNVRGFTLERVLQVMPDIPASTDIINLSLESLDDMEKMRTWFQWAPRGAFIIFDETQLVFPKAWREKDLDRFDFPGGPEEAQKADRPMSWLDGWTRHRHWNWDIVLTTPNISYIRDDIRMTCEMAYRHSNLAVIGIKGRYKESQHDAQQNRAPADGTIIEYKRIKPDTFKLYQSTATGATQDTTAGKSLFKSPKLLLLLALMAGLPVLLLSFGSLSLFGGGAHKPTAPAPAAPASTGAAHPGQAAGLPAGPPAVLRPGSVGGGPPVPPDPQLNHPFAGRTFYVLGAGEGTRNGKFFRRVLLSIVDDEGRIFQQSSDDLAGIGYTLVYKGPCFVELTYRKWKGTATCRGSTPSEHPLQPANAIAGRPSSLITPDMPNSRLAAPVVSSEARMTVVSDSEYASRPWR